jgi:hypothetical protein
MNDHKLLRIGVAFGTVIIGVFCNVICCSASDVNLSEGATVYVPVYSHIYVGIKGQPFDLAISLSIRNTDPTRPITVSSVAYHDSRGRLVKHFLETPVEIPSLASVDFFVSESDTTGGFGAAFVVKWKSTTKVNEPIVEGVMAGTRSGQGISFTTRGQVIEESGR